jgi:hypothetical protein
LVVFSLKVGRERKKTVWRQFCECYLQLWLVAHCCQPAVAAGIIYADLRGEFSTQQALSTQSSPVHEPLLQAFPFPSTLGDMKLHPLSQACMFVSSSHGRSVYPLSCGVSLPPPLSQAFLLKVAVCMSGSRWSLSGLPSMFIYSSRKDSLPPILGAQCTPHSFLVLYCSYCLLLSFSFFPRCGSVYPGG